MRDATRFLGLDRKAKRGDAGRRDRDLLSLRDREAAHGVLRRRAERTLERKFSTTRCDYQDRKRARAARPLRVRVGMPTSAQSRKAAQAATARAQCRDQRDRAQSAASLASPLSGPHGARKAQPEGPRRHRPRAPRLYLGNRRPGRGRTQRHYQEARSLERQRRGDQEVVEPSNEENPLEALCGRALARIHQSSPRQLPTNRDHGGRPRLIPGYQSDQSSRAGLDGFLVTSTHHERRSTAKLQIELVRSLHISASFASRGARRFLCAPRRANSCALP